MNVWVQGARPRTLVAAVCPVLVGTAAAAAEGPLVASNEVFRPGPGRRAMRRSVSGFRDNRTVRVALSRRHHPGVPVTAVASLGGEGEAGGAKTDEHDAGVLKNGRIFRQCELTARDGLVKTFKARRPQAACLDFSDHARTRQQRNAAAAGRQHAANEAADAARPSNTNRLVRNHSPPTALHRASNSRARGPCLSQAPAARAL